MTNHKLLTTIYGAIDHAAEVLVAVTIVIVASFLCGLIG